MVQRTEETRQTDNFKESERNKNYRNCQNSSWPVHQTFYKELTLKNHKKSTNLTSLHKDLLGVSILH